MDPSRIPVIETGRLLLRGPTGADVDTWVSFILDPDFGRYVPRSKVVRTPRERAERMIANYQQRWDEQPLSAMGWAITRKSDGQLIGLGGIEGLPAGGDGELDYFLGKSYWGQGFATEAARAMVHFGFDNTGWERIVAAVVPANVPSSRVLDHLGFAYERDVNYYEMTGSDAIILEPPIVAYYALRRDQFVLDDAFYRLSTPEPS